MFSSQENILHILLDGFQSDLLPEVIERFPELERAFEGFIFFENNMGVLPTTRMSIPAILTGQIYQNRMPMEEFIADVMAADTLPRVLHHHGYQVDLLPLRRYRYGEGFSNWCPVPRPFADRREQVNFAAAALFDLSLLRHNTHLLRPFVYRGNRWLFTSLDVLSTTENRKHHPSNAIAFLRHYIQEIRVGDNQPRYKLIHLFLPHLPTVLDCDCRFIGTVKANRETFLEQSACSPRILGELLNALRAKGLYRDSLIVVTSDHGGRFPSEAIATEHEDPIVANRALALFLVKPRLSWQRLRYPSAPVSLSDIPATIADLAGIPYQFPGKSAVRVLASSNRKRSFYYYEWSNRLWNQDFLPELKEYVVNGHVLDPKAWQLRAMLEPPDLPSGPEIKIDVGVDKFRRSLGYGWGRDRSESGRTFAWAVGKAASMTIPRFRDLDTLITARLKPPPGDRSQVISVVVDGEEIAKWEAHPDEGWRTFQTILPSSRGEPISYCMVSLCRGDR